MCFGIFILHDVRAKMFNSPSSFTFNTELLDVCVNDQNDIHMAANVNLKKKKSIGHSKTI